MSNHGKQFSCIHAANVVNYLESFRKGLLVQDQSVGEARVEAILFKLVPNLIGELFNRYVIYVLRPCLFCVVVPYRLL